MLYCPALSPFSASRRLAGGTLKSSRFFAFDSMISFLRAVFCMFSGSLREKIWWKIFSVSLSAKLLIISILYTKRGHMSRGNRKIPRPSWTREAFFIVNKLSPPQRPGEIWYSIYQLKLLKTSMIVKSEPLSLNVLFICSQVISKYPFNPFKYASSVLIVSGFIVE